MTKPADVVVVGGGIAGAAVGLSLARAGLDVVVLEFQDEYRDLVRGEALAPWGVAEAERIGASDALFNAEPALLRQWVHWDEIYEPDEAPVFDLTQPFVPGVSGPLAIHHYRTCKMMAESAVAAGARFVMGARNAVVEAGANPSVTYSVRGTTISTPCRLVIGAGGRHGPVGKQVGLPLQRTVHHWGSGLGIKGLDGWPAGVQAMGTEDGRMFFVFPQRDGRARLYLNYASTDRHLYVGRDRTQRFLQAFDLKCLPYRSAVLSATPAGPCMSAPSSTSRMDEPFTTGVVLIGDEAGANCPVLGTGLSNAFRDARIVTEILLASNDWSPSAFAPYAHERRWRIGRLNFAADVLNKLFVEFGPDSVKRRKLAWSRMHSNSNYQLLLLAGVAGPERVPDAAFEPALIERLFASEKTPRHRPARLDLEKRRARVAS